jgi:hypothetical protein
MTTTYSAKPMSETGGSSGMACAGIRVAAADRT